ncbi:LacI family DNA-binding transcriptional regulator [Pararobbsia alpina]|uniref:substrate-binding domain-containing protein n=1 Tax=Pararobbsia alpina TaxID=621374 RepID=UPI0039A43936
MSVGIKALAKELNLSIATVSRALNSSGPVSADTRKRVLEAAAAMSYSPNISAGSLRKGRVDTIGLMLPVYTQGESYPLALFMALADGMQTVLMRHQLDLALFQSHSSESELTQIKRIVGRRQVDALIVSNTRRHDSRLDFLATQDIPFLAFGRSESGGEHAWLDLDIEALAEQAVDRLAGFGHRRIAVVMPGQDAMQAHIYLKSYKRALKRHGLAFDATLVRHSEFSERGGYRAADALVSMEDVPTAVLFQSDAMAIGAYRRFHEAGLTPGKDIAVTTGLLTGEVTAYLSPALTGFTLAPRELGMRMAEAMLSQIPGTGHYEGTRIEQVWPLQLVARPSDEFVLKA